jgi:hypothetical protein
MTYFFFYTLVLFVILSGTGKWEIVRPSPDFPEPDLI